MKASIISLSLVAALSTACATRTHNPGVSAPRDRHPDATGAPHTRPLTLDVSTHVAPAPAQVVVRTRVEPDAHSRSLLVEWWSGDGVGGSHEVSLNGRDAPARHDFAITRMAEGQYLVSAVLTRDDGRRVRRETSVVIVGEGDSLESIRNIGSAGNQSPSPPRSPWQ